MTRSGLGRSPHHFGQYILYLKKVWIPTPKEQRSYRVSSCEVKSLQRQYSFDVDQILPGIRALHLSQKLKYDGE